ncbi:intraflagellar transport protein 56 [Xyrichtys novacula]|uniref:Intraflagellar transport protein 56 n=1 Tax=Xyrichtys novacula TaxID=13765 RepID=A0AAV1EYM1_XYRNO|nr:intraflagellar transport protein 56 [Xyrichtys novacula]
MQQKQDSQSRAPGSLGKFQRSIGEVEEHADLWIGYCAFHLGDYKKAMKDFLALKVYVALCYYKLDYYDVSQEVLAVYLQRVPDSTIALNLKAELENLIDISSCSFEFAKELIRHNLVVFRGGEGALQVLPPLIDVIPEARLNLEYILKGVVNAALGQDIGSRDHLKIAQQFFQLVGGSASECDTIPGRQCMAACFFLLRKFDDVLIYLNSVKSYFANDDTFNFNYAQAKAALGNYKQAEEVTYLSAHQHKRL